MLLNGGNLLLRFGEVVMVLIRSTNVGRLWGLLAMICHHGQSNCVLMSKLRKLLQKGAYIGMVNTLIRVLRIWGCRLGPDFVTKEQKLPMIASWHWTIIIIIIIIMIIIIMMIIIIIIIISVSRSVTFSSLFFPNNPFKVCCYQLLNLFIYSRGCCWGFLYWLYRCSVLDIQLKREPADDVWSVSISHAAEVLQNWNLIGFQVIDVWKWLTCDINIKLSIGPPPP